MKIVGETKRLSIDKGKKMLNSKILATHDGKEDNLATRNLYGVRVLVDD